MYRTCLTLSVWFTLFLRSYTFRTAVRTFCGAPRSTCDNVIVDLSTPASGRGWCNPDLWLRLAVHGIGTTHIHRHASSNQCCQDPVVFSPSERVNQSPCQQLLPVAEERLRTSLSIVHAELSSGGKRDTECCFHQLGFPTHCPFIHDQHTTDLWPQPLTPLCVFVWVSMSPKGLLTM